MKVTVVGELIHASATVKAATAQVNTLICCVYAVSYTHLRAHETVLDLVCRLLLEKKKKHNNNKRLCICDSIYECILHHLD